MLQLGRRHLAYKVLLLLGFPLGLSLFLVGFATSRWTFTQSQDVKSENGLWRGCISDNGVTKCALVADIPLREPDWFLAVQVLQSLALAGLACGLILFLVVNCTRCSTLLNRLAEAVTFFAAITGIVGAGVYATEMYQSHKRLLRLVLLPPDFKREIVSDSFGLDLAGLLLLAVVAILIAVFDRPQASGSSPGRTFMAKGGVDPVLEGGIPAPGVTYPTYSQPGSVEKNLSTSQWQRLALSKNLVGVPTQYQYKGLI